MCLSTKLWFISFISNLFVERSDVAPFSKMRDCAPPTDDSQLGKLTPREKWGHAPSLSPCPGLAEIVVGHLTGLSGTNWSYVMCSRMTLFFLGTVILWPELSFRKLPARQRKSIVGLNISLQCITFPCSCVEHSFWERALDRKFSKWYRVSYTQRLEPHSSCLTGQNPARSSNVYRESWLVTLIPSHI